MQKGKGGYIMVPYAVLFAEDISQEEKVKKLLDHGKPVLLTEIGDGKNDVFVMPQETDDGVLLENVYGYDILVGEEETTSEEHQNGKSLYEHTIKVDSSGIIGFISIINDNSEKINTIEKMVTAFGISPFSSKYINVVAGSDAYIIVGFIDTHGTNSIQLKQFKFSDSSLNTLSNITIVDDEVRPL